MTASLVNIAFIEMRLRLPEQGGIENPAAYTHAAIAGDWAAAALRATDYKEQLGQEQERAQEDPSPPGGSAGRAGGTRAQGKTSTAGGTG